MTDATQRLVVSVKQGIPERTVIRSVQMDITEWIVNLFVNVQKTLTAIMRQAIVVVT